ncbi:MAG: LysR family transcriptional regulator [Thermoplasmata archaeon]
MRPRVVFVCDGQEITHRQMEALAALHETGSMSKAARSIRISTPVLHKYVRETEEKADAELVTSTSRGSKLTQEGLDLLKRFRAYELRLADEKALSIGGTVVSERCILTAATELSDHDRVCKVTISTDDSNLRLIDEGRVDCVVLDDAMLAMDRTPEVASTEIGSDMLLWKDAGERYARTSFGAQRLAFRYLKERDIPHEIAREIHEPTMLDHTDLSYFVNRSLVRNGVIRAEGAKEQRWSVHSIVAVQCTEHEDLPAFLAEAREAWLYRKG